MTPSDSSDDDVVFNGRRADVAAFFHRGGKVQAHVNHVHRGGKKFSFEDFCCSQITFELSMENLLSNTSSMYRCICSLII
jgi:hypothetical protein